MHACSNSPFAGIVIKTASDGSSFAFLLSLSFIEDRLSVASATLFLLAPDFGIGVAGSTGSFGVIKGSAAEALTEEGSKDSPISISSVDNKIEEWLRVTTESGGNGGRLKHGSKGSLEASIECNERGTEEERTGEEGRLREEGGNFAEFSGGADFLWTFFRILAL